jgi:hypothetical protein
MIFAYISDMHLFQMYYFASFSIVLWWISVVNDSSLLFSISEDYVVYYFILWLLVIISLISSVILSIVMIMLNFVANSLGWQATIIVLYGDIVLCPSRY